MQISIIEGFIGDPEATNHHCDHNQHFEAPTAFVEFSSHLVSHTANAKTNGVAQSQSKTHPDKQTWSNTVVVSSIYGRAFDNP